MSESILHQIRKTKIEPIWIDKDVRVVSRGKDFYFVSVRGEPFSECRVQRLQSLRLQHQTRLIRSQVTRARLNQPSQAFRLVDKSQELLLARFGKRIELPAEGLHRELQRGHGSAQLVGESLQKKVTGFASLTSCLLPIPEKKTRAEYQYGARQKDQHQARAFLAGTRGVKRPTGTSFPMKAIRIISDRISSKPICLPMVFPNWAIEKLENIPRRSFAPAYLTSDEFFPKEQRFVSIYAIEKIERNVRKSSSLENVKEISV